MGVRHRLTELVLGRARADRIRAREETADIAHLPDRRVMAEDYVPALAAMGGRILWVGTQAYTATEYAALEAHGAEVWTTDLDPAAARWGRESRHRTGDVAAADRLFADLIFDVVIFNGVVGFGVDEPDHQRRALRALTAVLRPGGLLLFGWNHDLIEDPVASGVLPRGYEAVPFAGRPSRVGFADSTHVYDVLRLREATSAAPMTEPVVPARETAGA